MSAGGEKQVAMCESAIRTSLQDLRSNAIEICVRASPDMERPSRRAAAGGFLLNDDDDDGPGVHLPRLPLTPMFSESTILFFATLAGSRKMEERLKPP